MQKHHTKPSPAELWEHNIEIENRICANVRKAIAEAQMNGRFGMMAVCFYIKEDGRLTTGYSLAPIK